MYAAYYDKTGAARDVLKLGKLAKPEPAVGEVLVRLKASGVNPSDVKKRAGTMRSPTGYDRVVPHSDGAGTIESVGTGVNPARIGERVWVWNAQWQRSGGTAAQFTAVPEAQAVTLPDHVSFVDGACLGIPAQTAWIATRADRDVSSCVVLIQGGAGAVGEMAIRIATQAGARVIATVSTDEKASIAESAGAQVIRYRNSDVVESVMELTKGRGVDHIVDVDFGANWRVDAGVLATNGSISAYSAPSAPRMELDYYAFAAKAASLRFLQVYLLPEHERLAAISGITTLMQQNCLPVRIAKLYTLDDIIEVHELQESAQAIGNIVIEI